MAMIVALLWLWLGMLVAGDTPVGRLMRRWGVEKPAARLSRISRMQVTLALLLIVIGLSAWAAMGHDGLSLYGMAMPELTGMLASIEMTSFIDAAIAATLVATSVRWSAVRTAVAQRLGRARARTVRARRPERPACSNDDDGPAGVALAA
jgi:hypothetical protein